MIPDITLEGLHSGDPWPEDAGATPDADTVRRLAALDASDREILGAHPPRAVVAEIERRRRRSRTRSRAAIGLALAATASMALWLGGPPSDTTTLKGPPPSLDVFRVGTADTLPDGTLAHAGDRLQLRYYTDLPYGAIVSIDGGGGVTLHHPLDGGQALLTPGHYTLLDRSFTLDAAPGFERFFLVGSDRPLRVADVLGAAASLAGRADASDGALPIDAHVTSVTVKKESR